MIYNCNDDIKKEIKKIIIDENTSLSDIAAKLNISRQQLNNIFNKSNFSFSDLNKICEAIGYKLEINMIKEEEKIFPKHERTEDNPGKSPIYKIG